MWRQSKKARQGFVLGSAGAQEEVPFRLLLGHPGSTVCSTREQDDQQKQGKGRLFPVQPLRCSAALPPGTSSLWQKCKGCVRAQKPWVAVLPELLSLFMDCRPWLQIKQWQNSTSLLMTCQTRAAPRDQAAGQCWPLLRVSWVKQVRRKLAALGFGSSLADAQPATPSSNFLDSQPYRKQILPLNTKYYNSKGTGI